ncbi:MAG: tetratricopeptide repeat protein [Myxococcota bacterium]|nr:tetratricopeptide repeat protein [Myxococcota bacterium]
MRTGRFSSRFSFTDSQLPVSFGRHRLIKRLGADPVGEFFLALWGIDEGMDQPRVLRCIYPEIAEKVSFTGMFSDEARSFSWMSSDNVVSVLETGFVNDVPFIAHERVEGIPLRRFLDLLEDRPTRCPWEIATFVAAEMYRGLDYVHRRNDPHGYHIGLTHGDVRPANVLVSFDGGVKLTNFSSALYEIVDQRTHTRLNTSRGLYLPPEGLAGSRSSEAGDLWGAAATLWTMLSGAPPGVGDPLETGPWRPTPLRPNTAGMPDELDVFLAKALSPTADERFPTAQKAREGLVRILSRHVTGHLPDNLASWVMELGQGDRDEEAQLLEASLAQEPEGRLEETMDQPWLSPGAVIDGRYRLLRKLGEGGMGVVFEAEHLELGRNVALKVLREPVYEDEIAAQRFRTEARIMASLDHEAIVRVFDSGVTATGFRYLAMELLSGQSMGDWIEAKHKASKQEFLGHAYVLRLVEIMARACDGLAAAHEAKVVHRDFKPDNVFLTSAGPRILDFGIARRMDNLETGKLTLQGHICGTAEYVAPEQVGRAEPAAPMDIYAAGVILYEALCGTTPFRQTTVIATLDRVRKGDPESVAKRIRRTKGFEDPTVPKDLERICLRALRKNPAERFSSAAQMAQALRALLPDLEARLRAEEPRVKSQRRLWPVVAIGAAVLCLSLVGTYALVSKSRSVSEPHDPPLALPPTGEPEFTMTSLPKAPPPLAASKAAPSSQAALEETKTAPQPESATSNPSVSAALEKKPEPEAPSAQLLEEGKAKVDVLIEKGNAALGRMDLSAAASSFSQATAADPRRADAWYGLGQVRFEEGRSEEALRHMEKALRLAPGKPAWRNFLGRILAAMGNTDKAVAQWRTVLKTHPENAEAKRLLEKTGAL